MSFFVTLVYISLVILSPAILMPEISKFRIQWWVGGLAVLSTAAMVPYYGYPLRRVQTLLVTGFLGSVLFSRMMLGWFGGTLFALTEFGATLVVFYLIIGCVMSLSRLRILAVLLVVLAFYAGARGIGGYFLNWERDTYVLEQRYWHGDTFDVVDRIRFVGSLADPNDLAQYFLLILPIILLTWRKGAHFRNLIATVPLLAYLGFIAYLTHSRGMIVGIIAMFMVYLGGKVNKTVAMLGSGAMAVVLLVANVSGGRAVSFSAGVDRIEAWSAGLGMFRGRPLVGIGYNLFTDHFELTAHNSYVLCFAELGIIGFFFWMGMLVTCFLGLSRLIEQHRNNPAAYDLVRWALALRLSLTGFAATAWFLSRTYAVLLYILIGMIVVLLEMGERMRVPAPVRTPVQPAAAAPPAPLPPSRLPGGVIAPSLPAVATAPMTAAPAMAYNQLPPLRWVRTTALMQFACLLVIYIMVRLRWAG